MQNAEGALDGLSASMGKSKIDLSAFGAAAQAQIAQQLGITAGDAPDKADWTRAWLPSAADGHDTLEWIAGQSWTNHKIGMSGLSAGATTTFTAASTRHPTLLDVDLIGFDSRAAWSPVMCPQGLLPSAIRHACRPRHRANRTRSEVRDRRLARTGELLPRLNLADLACRARTR
jgi:hypothetical protein